MAAHLPVGRRSEEHLPDFDRVARLYRWAEYALLGTLLERARTLLLPRLQLSRSALVLGDGDGRFLSALLKANPALKAVALDSSRTMLHLLQQRCAFAADRLRTHHGDLREVSQIPVPPAVDLVTAHFFFDCLSDADLRSLVSAIASQITPGALWLVSDFAVPRRQPWRLLGGFYVRALYGAFRLLTGLRTKRLPDVAAAMRHAGFERLERRELACGLLYSELWRRTATHPWAASAQLPVVRTHPPQV